MKAIPVCVSVCVRVCPQFDVVPVSPLQERLFLDAIELP